MKKTKKVISYIMLLVPLALPAGCSSVSSGSGYNADRSNQRTEADDEAEQLRLIVERYFEQQAAKTAIEPASAAASAPAAAASQESAGEEEPKPALVESPEELKEELAGLEKTGEWTAEDAERSQPAQCQLPQTAVIDEPVKTAPTVDAVLPQPLANAEPELIKKSAARKSACDFPVIVNKQVQFYLNLFQGKQRKNFRRWLERSSIYMPYISQKLQEAGLPQELVYLSMIESGFNPAAYSPSGASGLWQFIPSTARNFGLRVDSWADERRDFEKSTKAAAAYLKALHKQFGGDWHLAVAAYNAGEGAVERGLRQYGVKNFWDLARQDYLRLETKRYVPQMIAAVLIARNPEQYGFSGLRQIRPPKYELVKVPGGTDIKTVADSASLSVEQLRSLNIDLLKDQVPADKRGWLLKVPVGRSAVVAANLPKAQAVAVQPAVASAAEYTSHKVAKNETLQQISRKYSVSMTALLKVNSLRSSKLKAGQSLRIPLAAAVTSTEQYALVKQKRSAKENSIEASDKIAHKLKKGETLSEVGEKYHVSVAAIMKWNQIGKISKVKAGQEIVIHLPQEAQFASAADTPSSSDTAGAAVELTAAASIKRKPVAAKNAQKKADAPATVVMLSGSKKQKAGTSKAEVSYYKVRNGDSLWSISKKLQVSTREIKNWNRLDGKQLQPGTTLVIKNG